MHKTENKMYIPEILTIGLVTYLLTFGLAHSSSTTNENTFLTNKETYVTALVTRAQEINGKICNSASSSQPGKCSRRECRPISNETGIECVPVVNNSVCSIDSKTVCNWIGANFDMSYVRAPPLNLSFSGDIESFVGSAISAQKNLDPTFREVHNNITHEPDSGYFYNLYFGDAQGVSRYYPGREINQSDCDKFDPRIRPWYIGAISIVKDLVVLINTGSSMSKPVLGVTNGNSTTPLEGAMAIIENLMYTLTNNDRVTIIPFNENSFPKETDPPYYSVSSNGLDQPPTKDPKFKSFMDKLNSADFSASDSKQPSDYTTGFAQALSVFKSPGSNPDSLKIVILFTYIGNPPLSPDVLNLTSTMFGNQSRLDPRLFVYELGDNQTSFDTHEWSSIASQVGGYNEQLNVLDVITNPLASLHSYFSFMARSRRDFFGGKSVHFWKPRYWDASHLGWVMTVALPALSSEGELVGVVGLDVQTDGLTKDLQGRINAVFANDNTKQTVSPSGANGANFTNNYGGFYKYGDHWNFCQDARLAQDNVFCPQNDFEADFLSLTCCGVCALGTRKSSMGVRTRIGVGVASVGAISVTVLIFFIVKKSWKARIIAQPKGEYFYEEIRKGTRNFRESLKISRGLFGVVYRASLRGERTAVQVLERVSLDLANDFYAQFDTGGIASHPNVVGLKGICLDSPDTRFFLVYELVERGNLQSWLFPQNATRFLTWPERKKIAWGIAKGLNHLHNGLLQTNRIFHLDIKPHNILLDEKCNPKIADFCVSQLYEFVHIYRMVTVSATNSGHWPPEVLLERTQPNSKVDVYSFGMVLLQLVSGRKVDDPDLPTPNLLLPWARQQTEHGNATAVIDNRMVHELADEYNMETVREHCLQLINLALRCLSVDPNGRPEMDLVSHIIDGLCTDDGILESIRLNAQSQDHHPHGGLLKTISTVIHAKKK